MISCVKLKELGQSLSYQAELSREAHPAAAEVAFRALNGCLVLSSGFGSMLDINGRFD